MDDRLVDIYDPDTDRYTHQGLSMREAIRVARRAHSEAEFTVYRDRVHRDHADLPHDHPDYERFKPGHPRLTDEFLTAYEGEVSDA